MTEWTTQRISKANVKRINDLADGRDFDARLKKILETVDYWEEDLIEAKIEEKIRESRH